MINIPSDDKVTSENKESIEEALVVIEELLSEENVWNLTEEEKKEIEAQQEDLIEKLEKIQAAEEGMEAVKETGNGLPSDDKVTSENKESIEEALEVIEELLSEENVGNLTEEEKKEVESKKEDLIEKLEKIQAAEEGMEAV